MISGKLLLCLFIGISLAAIEADRVLSLPHYNEPINFKHYAGYITVDESHGRALFYWFVESQRDPSKDPVVLWLNGGPGCSSMDGFFYEHGPFHFNRSTTGNIFSTDDQLHSNPFSWNLVANVIYLESPAGVGYSYSNTSSDYHTNDNKTAMDAYNFLQSFFNHYPEYSSNEFYVSGESYAGVYVPTLSALINYQNENSNDPYINLQGMLVGNGVTDETYDSTSFYQFAYNHALYSPNIYNTLVENNCLDDPTILGCDVTLEQMYGDIGNINIYDIYKDCYAGRNTVDKKYFYNPLRGLDRKVGLTPPCINSAALTKYLNLPEVRKAVHALPETFLGPWEICSNVVRYDKLYPSVLFAYQQLTPKIRVLVYSGDTDGAVSYVGTVEWTRFFENGKIPSKDWVAWSVLADRTAGYDPVAQVAGYVTVWDDLRLVTFRGAGHMVPQFKPLEAYAMFSSFLNYTFP